MIKLKLLTTTGLNVPEIEDITDKLPKNKNYTWKKLKGERDINALTDIAIHHTGVPKAYNVDAYTHARNHVNGKKVIPNGEPGIPYHVYIKNGQIYQCNDLLDFTYGVRNNNEYTVHIAIEGEYSKIDSLTDIDRNALYAAILAIKSVLPNVLHVKGHNEYVATSCPGFDMNKVRSDIQDIEQRIQYKESEENRRKVAYAIINQMKYLYDITNSEDAARSQWAVNKLVELEPVLKSKGLL